MIFSNKSVNLRIMPEIILTIHNKAEKETLRQLKKPHRYWYKREIQNLERKINLNRKNWCLEKNKNKITY